MTEASLRRGCCQGLVAVACAIVGCGPSADERARTEQLNALSEKRSAQAVAAYAEKVATPAGFDQRAEDARAAREGLATLFRLSYDKALEAAADSDADTLAACKAEVAELGDVGLEELVAVLTGRTTPEAKLLAVGWLGDLVAASTSHPLQKAAADALLTYRDSAPDEASFAAASRSLMACLEAASRSEPRDALIWLCLGDERLTSGEHDAAIEALDKALEIDAALVNAHYLKGMAYRRQGDDTRAIECYTAALELQPQYADIYVARSISRRALDDAAGAMADITTAIRQDSTLAHAYEIRAELHAANGDEDLARADRERAAALRAAAAGKS